MEKDMSDIFPKFVIDMPGQRDNGRAHGGFTPGGLTKRELFAAMAMQGQLANSVTVEGMAGLSNLSSTNASVQELVAIVAVSYADALLLALEKGPPTSRGT
jgi:hypothetical protein